MIAGYEPGSAGRSSNGMVVFTQRVKKIKKKARKLELKYEALIAKADKIKPLVIFGHIVNARPLLKAARIRRSYMNLAKRYPNIVK